MWMKTNFDEWQAFLPVLVLAFGLAATGLGALQETPEATAIAVALVTIF